MPKFLYENVVVPTHAHLILPVSFICLESLWGTSSKGDNFCTKKQEERRTCVLKQQFRMKHIYSYYSVSNDDREVRKRGQANSPTSNGTEFTMALLNQSSVS